MDPWCQLLGEVVEEAKQKMITILIMFYGGRGYKPSVFKGAIGFLASLDPIDHTH